MTDEHIYDESPGGGLGSGTTSGQTGTDNLEDLAETFDDRDVIGESDQEEGLRTYKSSEDTEVLPSYPEKEISENGPFHNLVHAPTDHSLEGVSTSSPARIPVRQNSGIDPEKELEAAQQAANNATESDDQPALEVS